VTLYTARVPRLVDAAPAGVDMGDTPGSAHAITLTNRFVERDGRPWIPVMGEYHYARDDESVWELELRKLKAGGITVVATYAIWILHEEVRGERSWAGNRNLRRFVELAAEVGLLVVARIGPWVHGETRNGGFPDWLQALPVVHRTNDPAYLDLVRDWYRDIAVQLDGLLHGIENPDAPVIGIQIENELYDQPDHLDTLRTIAEQEGLAASLWIATGWGGAQLPADRMLPVYAGYSDGFWEESDVEWPAFGRLHFSFSTERDDLSVGADLRVTDAVASDRDYRYPHVTCELGGGMQAAYHRRPLVDPTDVAALALTKLGSGSAWQGYYLYHGVVQQRGPLSGTQESQETGYPNDLPLIDYDFFAPVGSHGQLREHYHLLRQQHLFIERYGDRLAVLPATIPADVSGGPRWSVRGGDGDGFLFVNNHQPAAEPLPAIADVQFSIGFSDATVTLPSASFELPADASFVWPLRQPFGDIPRLTATVQPVTELPSSETNGPAGSTVVFAAVEGIAVELLVEGVERDDIRGAVTVAAASDGLLVRPLVAPGPDCVFAIGETTVVVLDALSASRLWRADAAGVDTLFVWPGGLVSDDGVVLRTDRAGAGLLTFPALAATVERIERQSIEHQGAGALFARYAVRGPDAVADQRVSRLREVTGSVPARTGGPANRLSAPLDADFAAAAVFRIDIDTRGLESADEWLLRLDWVGDVARVFIDGDLVSDQFWSGRVLDVDLGPFRDRLASGVVVEVLPWRPDSGVFVDARVRPHAPVPIADIRTATIIPTRTLPTIGAPAS